MTHWNHACFVRFGVRVTDFKPRQTTVDVAPRGLGIGTYRFRESRNSI